MLVSFFIACYPSDVAKLLDIMSDVGFFSFVCGQFKGLVLAPLAFFEVCPI